VIPVVIEFLKARKRSTRRDSEWLGQRRPGPDFGKRMILFHNPAAAISSWHHAGCASIWEWHEGAEAHETENATRKIEIPFPISAGIAEFDAPTESVMTKLKVFPARATRQRIMNVSEAQRWNAMVNRHRPNRGRSMRQSPWR